MVTTAETMRAVKTATTQSNRCQLKVCLIVNNCGIYSPLVCVDQTLKAKAVPKAVPIRPNSPTLRYRLIRCVRTTTAITRR
jgi:hypothetical protein